MARGAYSTRKPEGRGDGPTRRLRARAAARWVRMQEPRGGWRSEEMTCKRRFSDTKFCLQNPPYTVFVSLQTDRNDVANAVC